MLKKCGSLQKPHMRNRQSKFYAKTPLAILNSVLRNGSICVKSPIELLCKNTIAILHGVLVGDAECAESLRLRFLHMVINIFLHVRFLLFYYFLMCKITNQNSIQKTA